MVRALLLASSLLLSAVSQAASLGIAPIRLDLNAQQKVGVLSIRNEADTPQVVQVRVYRWTQTHGEDVYTPSDALIATPELFRINARASQSVRVGLPTMASREGETAYRLYIEEVPDTKAPRVAGLQMRMRFGVPVFVTSGRPQPRLTFALESKAGAWQLRGRNDGNAHLRLNHVELLRAGAAQPAMAVDGLRYLLPGSSYSWPLRLQAEPGSQWLVKADSDAGPLAVPVRALAGR